MLHLLDGLSDSATRDRIRRSLEQHFESPPISTSSPNARSIASTSRIVQRRVQPERGLLHGGQTWGPIANHHVMSPHQSKRRGRESSPMRLPARLIEKKRVKGVEPSTASLGS